MRLTMLMKRATTSSLGTCRRNLGNNPAETLITRVLQEARVKQSASASVKGQRTGKTGNDLKVARIECQGPLVLPKVTRS